MYHNDIYETKHYLVMWAGLIENREKLFGNWIKTAKIFFNALNELPKEEIDFLAEKYLNAPEKTVFNYEFNDHMSRKPITDKVLAERHGIKLSQYTNERKRIEGKLKLELELFSKLLDERERESLSEYVLSHGCLYLKRYAVSCTGQFQEDFLFTRNIKLAKRFSKDNPDVERLCRNLKLTKESPDKEDDFWKL